MLQYENVKEEQKGPALIVLRWSFNITKASRRQRVRWLFISPDENASHLCERNKDANKKGAGVVGSVDIASEICRDRDDMGMGK